MFNSLPFGILDLEVDKGEYCIHSKRMQYMGTYALEMIQTLHFDRSYTQIDP